MRFITSIIFLLFVNHHLLAQVLPSNRTVAAMQLADLKKGALVVRLKTNENSVNAYRKAGRNDIADRIVRERETQNIKLIDAFRTSFDFCKVYFIMTKNSKALLDGKHDIFVNDKLLPDSTIRFDSTYFLFAEYGGITTNVVNDDYHYSNVNKTEASATTASTSVIFISDTTFTQLREPFPFYQTVYLDNFNKAVDKLNRALYKSYYTLVEVAEMKKRWKK
jgi:hypothetical protein